MIIANSAVFTMSMLTYSNVAGVPMRVIKQWNFDKHTWEAPENREKEKQYD